jgi:ATP-dependent helicase/nuclease subunit A
VSAEARKRAQAEQLAASDPAVSAFVAASAGSGKTKLLIDRLLRLMLSGADPARIQCLTFTNAAAAEMAIRLRRVLGAWVAADDATLDAALRGLEVEPDAERRALARALFARVLDLPGGMRIGTIHAFCQSLLRRFPLEAALSPHFRLADERDAGDALREAREDALADADQDARRAALATIAGRIGADGFGELVLMLLKTRDRIEALAKLGDGIADAQRRVLGVTAWSDAEIVSAATEFDAADLLASARVVAQDGAATCRERAAGILDWLGQTPAERAGQWDRWCELFLRKDGTPFANTGYVNKALADGHPDLVPPFLAEAARVVAVEEARDARYVAELSAALVTLALPVLEAYEKRKTRGGLLDYNDLIGRTSRLLIDPGAAWVLYKLDGGLDHLLLDEVQDTAPAQWRIAGGLTSEFFAGEGAASGPRTIFAVGDRKQSIYSFQGADAEAFDYWRDQMRSRVQGAGAKWRGTELDVSFRSTAPVLSLVDTVFEHSDAAAGVVPPGETLRHIADRQGHAGQVELWPLVEAPEPPDAEPWAAPRENYGLTNAMQRLADTLAGWIAARTNGSEMLESRGRPLAPGDVMILVRRRNEFTRALVRALKARGVPVAGLDRLTLTKQPAVRDLLALGATLLLPEDDFSLACVLTSPLGGLDDPSLMELAAARTGTLWEALQTRADEREDWRAAHTFIATLLAEVDFTTPHALLSHALGALGGRARLLARLGPEAAEPVDELLNAALVHGRGHPPSLQGFLHWIEQSGAEVKREPEQGHAAGAGVVRVMTVHAAKGLQAPVVILPDTTWAVRDGGPLLWVHDDPTGTDVPIWAPQKELRRGRIAPAAEAAIARQRQEENRLLYVALTRAEDRIVVCGWMPKKSKPGESCWYRQVERGFTRLGATPDAEAARQLGVEGAVLRHSCPQEVAPDTRARAEGRVATALPGWAGAAPTWRAAPAPSEPPRAVPLAPSRAARDGDGDSAIDAGASRPLGGAGAGVALLRGRVIHALLQHLPELPASRRADAARDWLARPGSGIAPAEQAAVQAEVLAVLDHPALAPLFGPGSRAEVPLTGTIPGAAVGAAAAAVTVGGLVDRLVVLPDRVLIADYKTDRDPPAEARATPVAYLRQMAAYRAVLRAVFPGRAVTCALVWTRAARVSMLPDELLDTQAAA